MMRKKVKKMKKITDFLNSDFGKGLVAILRNAVIVALGLIISGLVTLISGSELSEVTKLFIIGALKVIDEYLHKTGLAEKGITRF
jgi:hypothetical protein